VGKFSFVFIGLLILFVSCGQQGPSVHPTISSMTISVYASATVQPDSLYAVYAAVGGIVESNLVAEGDRVKRGDGLIKIVNSTPRLNSENARLNLELIKANYEGKTAVLKDLKNEIASAQLKLQNDSTNYFRQKKLWEQGIGSQNDYDTRKLAYEVAVNQLKSAQNQLARTKNELETQLQQAENNYISSRTINEDYTVTSKIEGKVYSLLKNPGELVSGQEPLAHLGSHQNFILELLVDEVDIAKIRLGQEILVVLEAYPDQVFEALISKIYPSMDTRSQTFLLEGLFLNQPDVLYPGLTGEANIIIEKKEEVMTIPLAYLEDGDKVKTDQGSVSVKTGQHNLERIEILSGLDTNSVLVKPN